MQTMIIGDLITVEMVGGLSSSLINNASAADLAGLGSANLSSSYGSGLNVNNSGTGSGGGYLTSGNSFNNPSGEIFDSRNNLNPWAFKRRFVIYFFSFFGFFPSSVRIFFLLMKHQRKKKRYSTVAMYSLMWFINI